jgi:myo-inositol-1(or 4)-monophosphatase
MKLHDPTPREITDFETIARETARAAGALVLEGFRRQFQVSTKGPHAELFTEYDVRSEDLVRKLLAEKTPGVAIVGEEGGGAPGSDLTWYIDPIDGTINFIAGHPFFAVSVGIMRGSEPLAGAVYAPVLQCEWVGSVTGGTRKNGEPCYVSQQTQLSDVLMTTSYPSRSGVNEVNDALRARQLSRLSASVRDVRRCGSAAIDLCMVADGTYELSWMRRISPWDIAAGAAMVLGAGGTFEELEPGTPGAQFLTTNGYVRAAVVELLTGVR